ncbi:hypothetical protein [Candidatus Cytomitobacter primus]|uniref:Uncharacterized protein n=1 Tax=Candidatus Cytomitobacter primus TaxID=2066024 RepID=A0A5C0UFF7_9PROT|nr:hypothetical protein [Candidatus Cytomitobacter primus]QEK38373.1 hypothetical protein FZC34_00335 [Candidatus Cytomitobacter primus]
MSVAVLKKRYLSRSAIPRGRPKISKVHVGPTHEIIKKKLEFGLQDTNMPINLLSSMYSLKKINQEEYEAARFYEELSYKALGLMDCSGRKTSSLMVNLSNAGTNHKTFTKDNQKLLKRWLRVRAILFNTSKEIDEVIYNVLVKNKPIGFNYINTFKEGLNIIYDYCSKSKIKQSTH